MMIGMSAENSDRPAALPPRCPCCYCRTISERDIFDICPVCFWEDDGQDDHNADDLRGGPNGALSLTEARANYARIGVCQEESLQYVRGPRPDERPSAGS